MIKQKIVDILNVLYQRWLIYPLAMMIAFAIWLAFLVDHEPQKLLIDYWSSAVTMLFGSIIAGSTPLGGGAVAFPVFTKILSVSAEQAKLFSLFIQSVGMTFATVFFISLRIKIFWHWLLFLLPGSALGLYIGLYHIQVYGSEVKLASSVLALVIGFVLLNVQVRMVYKEINHGDGIPVWTLIALSFPAGILSALIGSGADALLFFLVTGLYKSKPVSVIPTTIAYMACCSIIGTVFVFSNDSILISDYIVNSWMISAPIVAIGAPLGGFIICRSKSSHVTIFIVFIILLEALSTLLFVNISFYEKFALVSLILVVLAYLTIQFQRLLNQSFSL